MKCSVCSELSAKYNCPDCGEAFCSVKCYSAHASVCTHQRTEKQASAGQTRQPPSDSVSREASAFSSAAPLPGARSSIVGLKMEEEQRLRSSDWLKEQLQHPRLQEIIGNVLFYVTADNGLPKISSGNDDITCTESELSRLREAETQAFTAIERICAVEPEFRIFCDHLLLLMNNDDGEEKYAHVVRDVERQELDETRAQLREALTLATGLKRI